MMLEFQDEDGAMEQHIKEAQQDLLNKLSNYELLVQVHK